MESKLAASAAVLVEVCAAGKGEAMLKRALGILLVVAILTAPVAAFGAPRIERVEQQPTWLEKVWEELKVLFWDQGPRQRPELHGEKGPRTMAAANEGSQGHDPDG